MMHGGLSNPMWQERMKQHMQPIFDKQTRIVYCTKSKTYHFFKDKPMPKCISLYADKNAFFWGAFFQARPNHFPTTPDSWFSGVALEAANAGIIAALKSDLKLPNKYNAFETRIINGFHGSTEDYSQQPNYKLGQKIKKLYEEYKNGNKGDSAMTTPSAIINNSPFEVGRIYPQRDGKRNYIFVGNYNSSGKKLLFMRIGTNGITEASSSTVRYNDGHYYGGGDTNYEDILPTPVDQPATTSNKAANPGHPKPFKKPTGPQVTRTLAAMYTLGSDDWTLSRVSSHDDLDPQMAAHVRKELLAQKVKTATAETERLAALTEAAASDAIKPTE